MPLFYQHNINESASLAVWQIAEDEDFFLEKVPVKNEIMHPHKRLQHLAGRYLLQLLHPGFPMNDILIAESKKPFLLNGNFHISISHCRNYAAAIVSKNKPVGIDVEIVTPKIELVKNRFLTQAELKLSEIKASQLITGAELLTLFWSTKETIYKWYGYGALSFKNNINITDLGFGIDEKIIEANFIKDGIFKLQIGYQLFGELCLTWI